MKVTIDTTNRIIEIESATTDELKQLCKDYKGFMIQSKIIYNNYPTIYPSYQTFPTWEITTDNCTTTSN